MKKITAALAGLFALALPSAALAQCSGIFTAGYFCGNSAAGGGFAGAASPTAMFDRAFGGTNNSTVVRLGGVWTVLSSANSGVWITSAAGVPSISSTLPNAVQDNITRLGTIANGTWNGAVIDAAFGGFGTSVAAASGVPLFAAGVPTFTSTSGTGNFVRVDQPTLTTGATILSTTTGAGFGPFLSITRNNASVAANDLIGAINFTGSNSTPALVGYAGFQTKILGKTAGAENGQMSIQSVVSGSFADRVTIGQGMQVGSPTGGDKGAATLNATTLYQAGIAINPAPTRAGDIIYWNGSAYVSLPGNNSGTNVLTENSSGVPSWAAPGTGTVTSVATGQGLSGGTITTTGTLTIDQTAYSTYTPTLSCFSGTLTTSSATGRSKTLGKTVFVQITITITTVGTCTFIAATLPTAAAAFAYSLPGYVTSGTNNQKFINGRIVASGTTVSPILPDGATDVTANSVIAINGSYEIP